MSVKLLKEKQPSTAGEEDTEKPTKTEDEVTTTPVEDPDAGLSLYEKFLKAKKKEWTIFNIGSTLISIAMAVGTFFVIKGHDGPDCKSLKSTLYMVLAMHAVNTVEAIINLIGLERKICSGFVACMFFLFEATVILYMQVVYFGSMANQADAFEGCL